VTATTGYPDPDPGRGRARRRRIAVLIAAGLLVWALIACFFAVDVTEHAVVTRFGRVLRVLGEPGLHVKAPFDSVVRIDKRLLFTHPAQAEYLTIDKKNVVVESFAVWRIADPERFLRTMEARSDAEARLADVVLGEIGAVLGRYPSSALITADRALGRYRAMVAEIREHVAGFARPMYGIDITDVELRHISLPEQNKEHVFERMKAERGKIAKEHRSSGELEAKKIIAAADREKSGIEAEAYAETQRLKGEGDAEASRIYAAAFSENPKFYMFLRTLQAYDKFLDDSTTLFLPADAEVLELLRPTRRPEAANNPAPPWTAAGALASPHSGSSPAGQKPGGQDSDPSKTLPNLIQAAP
jgi:membrane protease subunit HflC